MAIIKRFLQEAGQFSKANWWVYIMYVLLLTAVVLSKSANFISITAISSLHFVADIFIMMMFGAYTRRSYAEGTYFQIMSMIIFTSIKIYTGLVHNEWQYITADPIYFLAAIKNYRKDVKGMSTPWINLWSALLLSIIIFGVIIYIEKVTSRVRFFTHAPHAIQILGILGFAFSLIITENERRRYELSLVALVLMVSGSAWEVFENLSSRQVTGLAISYTLLPLTVLVFYLKRWSYYMRKQSRSFPSVT